MIADVRPGGEDQQRDQRDKDAVAFRVVEIGEVSDVEQRGGTTPYNKPSQQVVFALSLFEHELDGQHGTNQHGNYCKNYLYHKNSGKVTNNFRIIHAKSLKLQ